MSALLIIGLQTGLPRTLGMPDAVEPMDREWTTGFFKEGVAGVRQVTALGIEGDGQADLINHGGQDKAINVYPSEHYPTWMEELGLDLQPGAFGENFTTTGMTESEVCVGDVFQCGALRLQVSQPRQPCWKLARRWRIKDLAAQVERTGRTGWYFRVLSGGPVRAGMKLERVERLAPAWSISAANEVMHHRKTDAAAALALAGCPGLSASWHVSLTNRAASGLQKTRARLNDPLGS
ncbi:MAG: MOSC domain-containing protein [Prosthecobacter sp.]|uniref:MOSC domain-containing protein n=1 Tax=Prosthecobacter sp. TaxID=1965333 RepID=UPI003902D6A9